MGRERAQRVLCPEQRGRREYEVHFLHRVAYQQCEVGASLAASQLVFSNNQIDHFGDDGIVFAGSNLAITQNDMHDNLDIGDGNHEDAMQGVIGVVTPGVAVNHFQNILIDSNLVVRQTEPEPFLSDLSARDRRLQLGLDERDCDQQRRDHQRLPFDLFFKHPQQPDRQQYGGRGRSRRDARLGIALKLTF